MSSRFRKYDLFSAEHSKKLKKQKKFLDTSFAIVFTISFICLMFCAVYDRSLLITEIISGIGWLYWVTVSSIAIFCKWGIVYARGVVFQIGRGIVDQSKLTEAEKRKDNFQYSIAIYVFSIITLGIHIVLLCL